MVKGIQYRRDKSDNSESQRTSVYVGHGMELGDSILHRTFVANRF